VDQRDRRSPRRLPVLIANGFAPFPIPLHLVRDRFRALGHRTHVVPFRMKDMMDVEAFAEHIVRDARKLRLQANASRVNILGFSMGGVASLYAIKRLDLAAEVATFAGLGSPFHGATLSWFAVPSAVFSLTGLQLVPNSSFLRKLHDDPLPPGPRYVSVAGTNDLVCPPHTACLDGAEQHELPLGHAEFILDRSLVELLAPLLG